METLFALLSLVVLSFGMSAIAQTTSDEDFLYQYSLMDALMAGVYDGEMSFSELKVRGDFGIGGFNGLDGELYMDREVVFRIRGDGSVQPVPDSGKTPAAFVKRFRPDERFRIEGGNLTREALEGRLNERLERNGIYAIRTSGEFSGMRTRAPSPATRPYPELQEHLKDHQNDFNLGTAKGVLVGFYMPPYMSGINVPGYHFHFLTEDKNAGGHVIDYRFRSVSVEIDKAEGFTVELIDSDDFRNADLSSDRSSDMRRVERGE